jgi:hypothetical protein
MNILLDRALSLLLLSGFNGVDGGESKPFDFGFSISE